MDITVKLQPSRLFRRASMDEILPVKDD